MYSLNVPVPSDVSRRAAALARDLPTARARTRGDHTLVLKRLGTGNRATFQRLSARARDALAGTAPFAVRVAGVDTFPDPATGAAPVVYLAVESPELERLHGDLCDQFDTVAGIEGDEYTPHVTVARGGSVDAAERLAERTLDPIEWTVSELVFWDAERGVSAGSVSLPA